MGLSTPSRRAGPTDGLRLMKLDLIGEVAELARYIGYWKPYATSHEGLDANRAIQTGVRNAVLALAEAAKERRAGQFPPIVTSIGTGHDAPRPIWRDG